MPKPIQIISYLFRGWANEETRTAFHGSMDYFDAESNAGRAPVREGDYGIHKVRALTPERPPEGEVNGARLDVIYDIETSSPERVDQFFHDAGIKVERTN